MGYNVRKFAIRNQVFGSGPKRRVGIISARTIKVNGVKVKPGFCAFRECSPANITAHAACFIS